jgi:HEAT repeat protein
VPTSRARLATAAVMLLLGSLLTAEIGCGRQAQSTDRLLAQFEATTVSWQQLEVARRLASAGDGAALRQLEPWLRHEDRHLRGNAAFVFASLGDARGLEIIGAMLTDRSARPEGQGIPAARFSVARQITADRYYAVHLLGELRDVRAVDLLIPLLDDPEINYKVAWALGEIGSASAIPRLIASLEDRDALVRVSAIQALVELRATEALPRIRTLASDSAMPSAGDRVSVGDTARAAIATLQNGPRR